LRGLARGSEGLVRASRRLLVTEAGLGLTAVAERHRERALAPASPPTSLIASAERGLLLATDLEQVAEQVVGEEQLATYGRLIVRYLEINQANAIVLQNGQAHILRYYQLCHVLSSAPAALALWGEGVVRAQHLQPSATITSANLTLVDLLFRQGRDEDVLVVYQALQPLLAEHRSTTDHLLLAMALLAIARLRPAAGYWCAGAGPATTGGAGVAGVGGNCGGGGDGGGGVASVGGERLVREFLESRSGESKENLGRASFVLAWLALGAGEAAAAHEILHCGQGMAERRRALRTNLRLLALARLGRLGEAVGLLEELVDSEDTPERPDRTKAKFAREVVREVVEEVARAADPSLATRLRQVFRRLDASAEVVDQTVLELLLLPIQWNSSVERRPVSEITSIRKHFRPRERERERRQ